MKNNNDKEETLLNNRDKLTITDNIEVDINPDEPEQVVERRYPVRNTRPPSYLSEYATSVIDDSVLNHVDYCYYIVPSCYSDALRSPEAAQWKITMNEEMKSLAENDTFELAVLPRDKKAVGVDGCMSLKRI